VVREAVKCVQRRLQGFAVQMKTLPGMKKITEEEVLAPEFIITQGLRFAFDVHHPFRALLFNAATFLALMYLRPRVPVSVLFRTCHQQGCRFLSPAKVNSLAVLANAQRRKC